MNSLVFSQNLNLGKYHYYRVYNSRGNWVASIKWNFINKCYSVDFQLDTILTESNLIDIISHIQNIKEEC